MNNALRALLDQFCPSVHQFSTFHCLKYCSRTAPLLGGLAVILTFTVGVFSHDLIFLSGGQVNSNRSEMLKPQIMPRPLPYTPFAFHYSLFVLSFDVIYIF